jgi:A/G-specific adenine glycosylase
MKISDLIDWSEKEYAHLPWRQNRTLYRTLVSEIMLQQTTVGTVKNHYERFLKTFPDLKSLALASESELLVAWKGLGYYRRARSLKKIAEALFSDHKGEFPQDLEKLQEISGIGPYTASALLGIGMDKRALAVDANLERVIARLFGLKTEKGLKLQKEIQKMFVDQKIFSDKKVSFRALNEALMDLGRTLCQARKVTCELCHLREDCAAFKSGNPLSYPANKDEVPKKAVEHELHLLRVFVMKKNKLLVYKKNHDEWLSGQYEVPTFVLKSTDPKFKQYPKVEGKFKTLGDYKTGITKYSIINSIALGSEKDLKAFERELEWKEIGKDASNFSTAILKGLAALKKL